MHAACCNSNTWTARMGAATVFINGKKAHRVNDPTQHCGGTGKLIEGSPDVIVGDAGGGPFASGRETSAGRGSPSAAAGSFSARGGCGACSRDPPSTQPGGSCDGEQAELEQRRNTDRPEKQRIEWRVLWDDGRPIEGVSSKLLISGGRHETTVDPDVAGNHDAGEHAAETPFSLALFGQIESKGRLRTHGGKAVVGAKVLIERAFGPPVITTTDESGSWSAGGFVEGEPYEVVITEPGSILEGMITDHEGEAAAGVIAHIERSYGPPIELTTDAAGRYRAEAIVEDEDYDVTVLSPGTRHVRVADAGDTRGRNLWGKQRER